MKNKIAWVGLVAGPVLALITYYALPDQSMGADGSVVELGHAGRSTAGFSCPLP